jgi:hypothetical protein
MPAPEYPHVVAALSASDASATTAWRTIQLASLLDPTQYPQQARPETGFTLDAIAAALHLTTDQCRPVVELAEKLGWCNVSGGLLNGKPVKEFRFRFMSSPESRAQLASPGPEPIDLDTAVRPDLDDYAVQIGLCADPTAEAWMALDDDEVRGEIDAFCLEGQAGEQTSVALETPEQGPQPEADALPQRDGVAASKARLAAETAQADGPTPADLAPPAPVDLATGTPQ